MCREVRNMDGSVSWSRAHPRVARNYDEWIFHRHIYRTTTRLGWPFPSELKATQISYWSPIRRLTGPPLVAVVFLPPSSIHDYQRLSGTTRLVIQFPFNEFSPNRFFFRSRTILGENGGNRLTPNHSCIILSMRIHSRMHPQCFC